MCDECILRQLAAFVDGEGTISIGKTKKGPTYSYNQQIDVGNTDVRLISWLVDNFGGKFPKRQDRQRKNCKDTYQWGLTGKNSYKLIKKIREYLILKREQADCAIDLYEQVSRWNYGNSNPRPKYKLDISEELFQKCRRLNARGKPDEEDEDFKITVTIQKKKDKTWSDYEVGE